MAKFKNTAEVNKKLENDHIASLAVLDQSKERISKLR
jgi:hypothetical protein